MPKLSIKDLDLKGKRVFIRVDFNVPLSEDGSTITSDKRIKASMPSIEYALEQGAAVILASHLGRPKGKYNPTMSMKPVAARLAELLPGRKVTLAADESTLPAPGEVVLLENLRFHREEEENDPGFSKKLAAMCDVYVNDAFGSAHRAHASTEGITKFVKQAAAGLLMDKELEYLTLVTKNPPRPCIAVLGGSKVSDKIQVIENLAKVVDKLLIGGAMVYPFLQAMGQTTGNSKLDENDIPLAKKLLADLGDKLMLPVDHVVASEFKEGAENEVVGLIPDGKMGLDIGPKSVENFSEVLKGAKTIIVNGPMGVFEKPPFDKGTVGVFQAVAASGAVSVVGGGDSEKAVKVAGVVSKISHISTGGGASLEFLAGDELPGVVALTDK
jgi:phosphoglycerate kinase